MDKNKLAVMLDTGCRLAINVSTILFATAVQILCVKRMHKHLTLNQEKKESK